MMRDECMSLPETGNVLAELTQISKSFGAARVVDDVSLILTAGSVHALMGENGAGKSTLMKILSGVHSPDHGAIKLRGRVKRFASPREAQDAGVSTVFQEMSLLPNLSIAENMFLGREPLRAFGLLDRAAMRAQTRKALSELGLRNDPDTLVQDLSIAERQFVEIAHGIKADADIFILDEPTAALNAADVAKLKEQIAKLRRQGKAIVYISHRMDEIFEVCDTVTVMKDGRHVATRAINDLTPSSLIALMVGRDIKDLFPARTTIMGEPVLSLTGIQLDEGSKPFDLTLHAGEILALAGLEGQGQQILSRALIGDAAPVAGTLRIAQQDIALPLPRRRGVRRMQALGLALIPEDRKDEGLFLGLGIASNIAIGLHVCTSTLARARPYRSVIAATSEALHIRSTGAEATVGALSGGNQQKVLLGRLLASGAMILIIEEPTRGVDIGAKAEIYGLLRDFTENGGAILVLSRETLELIGLSDRILVMHDKTVVAEMPADAASEHNILDAALIQPEGEVR